METFDLESHLKGAYSSFPEAKHQPVIGLTANYENIDATLRDRYYKQVIAAGGTPVIIPPVADSTVIINTLEHLDGLILTGGGDHNPLWMGEEPSPRLHNINQERDAAELMLVRLAFNRQIPMLGICRGIQTLAIALGGKVYQDIKQMVKHSQDADRSEPTHSVEIKKDSTLYHIYNSEKILDPEKQPAAVGSDNMNVEKTGIVSNQEIKRLSEAHRISDLLIKYNKIVK
jgi:membrane dipeptidase